MALGSILADLDGVTGSLVGTLVPVNGGTITDLRSEQNLAAWYDASNSANLTVDSVGRVSQWNDTSTFASRHLLQGTAGSQPVYLGWSGQNYGYLPGVSGNYFSTPDSAAVSVTGPIDIRVKVALQNWTPATINWLVSKVNSDGQSSYDLGVVNTTGVLRFRYTASGTFATLRLADSTVAPTIANGATLWVRATYDTAGNVIFYTSPDGQTYTQLGATVAVTSGAIFDGSDALVLGASVAGGTYSTGNLFYAEIRNGINGTVVAAFDPSRAVDGASSFVAATGETWTVNTSGGKPAQIVGRSSVLFDGVDDLLKASAFTLNQPETVYLVGRQISWASGEYIFDGNALNTMVLIQDPLTPGVRIYAGTNAADNSGWAVGAAAVAVAGFNGASSFTQVNRGTAATGAAGAANAGGFTIGSRADAFGWSNIQCSAVAIFATAHDARTRARVINYLVSKYSIPV